MSARDKRTQKRWQPPRPPHVQVASKQFDPQNQNMKVSSAFIGCTCFSNSPAIVSTDCVPLTCISTRSDQPAVGSFSVALRSPPVQQPQPAQLLFSRPSSFGLTPCWTFKQVQFFFFPVCIVDSPCFQLNGFTHPKICFYIYMKKKPDALTFSSFIIIFFIVILPQHQFFSRVLTRSTKEAQHFTKFVSVREHLSDVFCAT